ncbi:hypothetical protein CWI38_1855p0010 [Hamiltosporidium tvaerminnensis]|uniref:Uncharacterized protein n=1 Tax=Hamiltosporidium tvaerminnensis TaxID=1176355 RepID=A0A4Q9LPN8_9MICR|nr:hypothetical protein CWI38_1855p0010 [Hamiltosporidium tvaerminnensis]
MPKKENITSPVNNNNATNKKNSSDDKNSMIEQQSESDIKEDKKNQNSEEKSDIKKDVNITGKTIINTKKNINDEDINNQEIQPSEYQNENPERKLLFENIVAQNDPIINIEYNNCSDIDNEYSNISSSNIDDEDDKSTYIEEETYNEIEYLSPEILNNCHNEDSNLSSSHERFFRERRCRVRTLTNMDTRDSLFNININGFFQRSNFSSRVYPESTIEPFSSPIEERELSDINLSSEHEPPIYSNTIENQSNNNNIFETLPQSIRFRTNRNIRNREHIRSRILNYFDRSISNRSLANNRRNRNTDEDEQNTFIPYISRLQNNLDNFYRSLDSIEGKYKNKFSGNSVFVNICESESDEYTKVRHPRRQKKANSLPAKNETNVSNQSGSFEVEDSSEGCMRQYACSNCCNKKVSDEKYKYNDQHKNDMEEHIDHDEMIDSDSEYSRQIHLWEYYRKYGKFAPEDNPSDISSNKNNQTQNNFDCKKDCTTPESKEISKPFSNNQSNSEFNKQSPKKQTWECSKKENEMTNDSSNTKKNSKQTKQNEKKKQENSETNQGDFNMPIHNMTWDNDITEIATEPQNNSDPCEEESEECSEFNEDSGYDAPNTDFDSEGEYYAGDEN